MFIPTGVNHKIYQIFIVLMIYYMVADTKDKLTLKQKNWLETFIDVWDCINQNT